MHNVRMINSIRLGNFKGINEEVEIKLSRITLIFGLNNVGKSSIIQSLDLVSNLSNKFLIPIVTDYKNYGSIESIVNKNNQSKSATIGINLTQRNEAMALDYIFSKSQAEFNKYDFYENKYKRLHTIKFDKEGWANFANIDKNRKIYKQLSYLINESIDSLNNSEKYGNEFKHLSHYLKRLKHYKKFAYEKERLLKIFDDKDEHVDDKPISIKNDVKSINELSSYISDEHFSTFLDNNRKELLLDKIGLKPLDFYSLFVNFFEETEDIQVRIEDYPRQDYLKILKNICLEFFDLIYIQPIKLNSDILNPRVRQRINRIKLYSIENNIELKIFEKNLDNMIKFFEFASKPNTKKNKERINYLIQKNIIENKVYFIKRLSYENFNFLKILQDYSSENQGGIREATRSFNLTAQLEEIRASLPILNIFKNNIIDQRVFTYQKSSNSLDKIFENKDNKEFVLFMTQSLNNLGFNISDIEVKTDENSFRIKIVSNGKFKGTQKIDLVDCGTGLKNLIVLVANLYDHTKIKERSDTRPIFDQITCIEEPEANLHPKFQAELGQLFAEISKNSIQSRNQILIETHSQNLTLRLLKLVRQGFIHPSDVALNCLYRNSKDEISVFTPEILDNGNFVGSWPGGFFDEDLYELND